MKNEDWIVIRLPSLLLSITEYYQKDRVSKLPVSTDRVEVEVDTEDVDRSRNMRPVPAELHGDLAEDLPLP